MLATVVVVSLRLTVTAVHSKSASQISLVSTTAKCRSARTYSDAFEVFRGCVASVHWNDPHVGAVHRALLWMPTKPGSLNSSFLTLVSCSAITSGGVFIASSRSTRSACRGRRDLTFHCSTEGRGFTRAFMLFLVKAVENWNKSLQKLLCG